MRFFKWIKGQVGRRDPIGDFARDAATDAEFPKAAASQRAVLLYLRDTHRVEFDAPAARAFVRAWNEYRAEHPAKEGRRPLSIKDRYEIFRRDGFRCQLCGASARTGATLEVDHKLPVSKGGACDEDNLWTLCFECNRGKAASYDDELP